MKKVNVKMESNGFVDIDDVTPKKESKDFYLFEPDFWEKVSESDDSFFADKEQPSLFHGKDVDDFWKI